MRLLAACILLVSTLATVACRPPHVVRETIAPELTLRRYVELVRAKRPDAIYQLLGGTLRARFSQAGFRAYFRDYYTLIRTQAEAIRARLESGTKLDTEARIRLASRLVRVAYEGDQWRLRDDPTQPGTEQLSSDPRVALRQVARWLRRGRLLGASLDLAPQLRARVQRGTLELLSLIDARLARGGFGKDARTVTIGSQNGPHLELVRTAGGFRLRRIRIPGESKSNDQAQS